MKHAVSTLLSASAILFACAGNALATQTPLVFRNQSPQQIYGGLTDHILGTNWGTTQLTLPFTGTTTYDFYSPRLVLPASLLTTDSGGGVIYMSNQGRTNLYNITVTGEMKFFDYDPGTGTQTLILDTGVSNPKNVNNNQTVNWSTPIPLLPAACTVPTNHMIHIALTIALVSGYPGNYVNLIYNGPNGSCTAGQLPQNRTTILNWAFDSAPLPPALSIFPQANGQMGLGVYYAAQTACSIQATTNLCGGSWVTLVSTNTDANGLLNFVDRDAMNYPCRFYRSVTP